jgi:hypothetical protein
LLNRFGLPDDVHEELLGRGDDGFALVRDDGALDFGQGLLVGKNKQIIINSTKTNEFLLKLSATFFIKGKNLRKIFTCSFALFSLVIPNVQRYKIQNF